jgi:hypothetical protein
MKNQSLQAFMPDCDWSLFAPLEVVYLGAAEDTLL